MNSVSYNAGRALAPAFSVLIVTTIGFAWAFTFNALSFGIFTIMLLTVRPMLHASGANSFPGPRRFSHCLERTQNSFLAADGGHGHVRR